jgi:hypothetical protein
MFDRTQVMRLAHSLKLNASPASTRCVSAENFAVESPTSSIAASSRCSTLCAAASSENMT